MALPSGFSRWSALSEPAPILATNHLFRGVAVPAGTHRVRFEYRPRSVVLGAAGTLIGWLGIALLAWRGRMATRMAGASGLTSTPDGW